MFLGQYAFTVPTCSVNDILNNTEEQLINKYSAHLLNFWISDYINLHPIRKIYVISNTLGTYNSMAVNGAWGILKKIPVSAD